MIKMAIVWGNDWHQPLTFEPWEAKTRPPKRKRKQNLTTTGKHLLTLAEGANYLNVSSKQVSRLIERGALRYVNIGHGTKRPRKRLTKADLDDFIEQQKRRDVQLCPSTGVTNRRTFTSTSKSEVIGFTAQRNARLGAKQKKSKR